MNRSSLFLRLLFKAAWVRKDRALTALISVAVVATIATAALTIYSDLEGKLSREFRGFGANVIVTKAQGSLTADEMKQMEVSLGGNNAGKSMAVPVAYAIATAPDGSRVVVGGADLQALRELNTWWSIRPIEGSSGKAWIGSRAASLLSPANGKFTITFAGRTAEIQPGLVFLSGSDDDSRIYLDTGEFTTLTGVQPSTALVRIEGKPQEIRSAIEKLSASLPQAEVKPVRQITQAQTAVVGKTRSVVLAASAVIIVLIMLCMVATFTSSVLERRKDFAVMKALGASNKTVNLLFAAEAASLALVGAAGGYMVGSGIAFWIGKANFDAAIFPLPVLLFPVLLGSVALALIASTAPLRLLQQIQPAAILRGE
jgi:putative ABC transport system permease protein